MAGRDAKGAGDPQAKVEARVLIIEARYYEDIGRELMAGAVAELRARGATYDVVSVPGALEIPQVLAQAAGKMLIGGDVADGIYDGAVALGCVIRGETSHYDIVCNNANHGLMETIIKYDIPFGNAVLTVDSREQAMARARGGRQGKGADAVRACLRMVEVCRQFEELGADVILRDVELTGLNLDEIDLDEIDLDDLDTDEIDLDDLDIDDPVAENETNGKSPKGRRS